jgi:hypothetical protein
MIAYPHPLVKMEFYERDVVMDAYEHTNQDELRRPA